MYYIDALNRNLLPDTYLYESDGFRRRKRYIYTLRKVVMFVFVGEKMSDFQCTQRLPNQRVLNLNLEHQIFLDAHIRFPIQLIKYVILNSWVNALSSRENRSHWPLCGYIPREFF